MAKINKIRVVFAEVVIVYNEAFNRWEFDLRGRRRSAESLAHAKEAIRKLPPKTKKPFTPVKVLRNHNYEEKFSGMEITSFGEEKYGERTIYVRYENGERGQERLSKVVEDSPHNREIVLAIKELVGKEKKLDKQKERLRSRLRGVKLPKLEEENEETQREAN